MNNYKRPNLTFEPTFHANIGCSAKIKPRLLATRIGIKDLSRLILWINGVDVTHKIGVDLKEGEPSTLEFQELDFGPGLHHLRAALQNSANTSIILADAYYEIAGAKVPHSVRDANGNILVEKKKCKCTTDDGGGNNGGVPNGSGQNGGGDRKECDKPQPGEPVEGDEGGPPDIGIPEDGDTVERPPKPKCRIIDVTVTPGLFVSQSLQTATLEVTTEPEDAVIEWSSDVQVHYEVISGIMANTNPPETTTRAELNSRPGARLFKPVSLGRGFRRILGPRKAEILINQIDLAVRTQLRGVVFQAAIGFRCPKEKWGKAVFTFLDE